MIHHRVTARWRVLGKLLLVGVGGLLELFVLLFQLLNNSEQSDRYSTKFDRQ